jgi:hypothetical protein
MKDVIVFINIFREMLDRPLIYWQYREEGTQSEAARRRRNNTNKLLLKIVTTVERT